MDKIILALIDAIKAGGPVAAHIATLYFVVDVVDSTLCAATFLGIVWMICSTVRWGMNRHYEG